MESVLQTADVASANISSIGNFILGPENRLVEVAFRAVLGQRNPSYNPIVLYGPTGVGKSHLAHELVESWRGEHRRGALYETASDFFRKLTDAFQTNDIESFRGRYRSLRLLVLDNVEELAKRPSAQEELIHTIDAHIEQTHRMVVTSKWAPAEISDFLPGLRGRLGGGLVVRLEAPGLAVREALVRRSVTGRLFHFTEAAILALSQGMAGTAPDLVGAVLHLGMQAEIESRAVHGEHVRAYLESRRESLSPRVRDIALAAARHFSLKLSQLRSVSRRQAVVRARGVAMYLARLLTDDSLERIGDFFGGRDHTTVLHACRKTEELLQADPDIHRAVERLRDKFSV